MIPILICDDDIKELNRIKTSVEECISKNSLSFKMQISTTKAADIINYLEDEKLGQAVYILDVELKNPFLNGIHLGNAIRKIDVNNYLIYITSHEEAAIQTYNNDLACIDFILKNSQEEMKKRIENCLCKIHQRIIDNTDNLTSFVYNHHFIIADKLLYIETSNQQHRIIIHRETDFTELWGRISDFAKLLPESFFQCHRGVIINLKKVKYIDVKKRKIYFGCGKFCYGSTALLKELKRIEPKYFYEYW